MSGLRILAKEFTHGPIGGFLRLQPIQQPLARRGRQHEARGYDDIFRDLVDRLEMVQERLFDHESFLQAPGTDVPFESIAGFGRDVRGNLGHVVRARAGAYKTVEKSSMRRRARADVGSQAG